MNYSQLFPKQTINNLIKQWLQEDIPSFDYGGMIVGDDIKVAHLLGKQNGYFSGKIFFQEIFEELKCEVQWFIEDGDEIKYENSKPQVLAHVKGPVRNILIGERLSLNILSRSCGITTRGKSLNLAVRKEFPNWPGKIAGTRKTTPGFRLVEKYALLVGGLDSHRMDLSSMIMLKDNHIWSCGNITNAVKVAKQVGGFSLKVEVECRSQDEAIEAINAGADVVMLDNFKPESLKEVSSFLKSKFPHVLIESSGGITNDTILSYICNSVDIISMGNLTQGVPHLDISLKIQK